MTHPQGGHPDGWFEFRVEDREFDEAFAIAKGRMMELCDNKWATQYDAETFSPEMYPSGAIRVFTISRRTAGAGEQNENTTQKAATGENPV